MECWRESARFQRICCVLEGEGFLTPENAVREKETVPCFGSGGVELFWTDEDGIPSVRERPQLCSGLNGYVNKQNCRIWSEANPQVYVETPLHPEKLTVWCALWAGGILLQKR
ncbi:hypothetical protein TNCV_2973581 [Trichonephila clavipes]|nr:hypothetical protein TNCV_2973581 [Trichonephila clavipes]